LAAYTAEKRKKEISIRKTMGASVSNLVVMMSRDFTKLSLLAILLGCPVAFFLMNWFLGGYAYHTPLTLDVFVATSAVVLVLSLVTVVFQVTKAAMANPVNSLRNE
jgi:ABC-type antimicrobial peptide transport system permease subunit